MTLTLDIPEELLNRAETYALAYGKSLESLLLSLLENSLSDLPPPPTLSHAEIHAYSNARMRTIAREQWLDWDVMDEEAKDQFLITVIED